MLRFTQPLLWRRVTMLAERLIVVLLADSGERYVTAPLFAREK